MSALRWGNRLCVDFDVRMIYDKSVHSILGDSRIKSLFFLTDAATLLKAKITFDWTHWYVAYESYVDNSVCINCRYMTSKTWKYPTTQMSPVYHISFDMSCVPNEPWKHFLNNIINNVIISPNSQRNCLFKHVSRSKAVFWASPDTLWNDVALHIRYQRYSEYMKWFSLTFLTINILHGI